MLIDVDLVQHELLAIIDRTYAPTGETDSTYI